MELHFIKDELKEIEKGESKSSITTDGVPNNDNISETKKNPNILVSPKKENVVSLFRSSKKSHDRLEDTTVNNLESGSNDCDHCSKTFLQNNLMKKHMKDIYKSECNHCEAKFISDNYRWCPK